MRFGGILRSTPRRIWRSSPRGIGIRASSRGPSPRTKGTRVIANWPLRATMTVACGGAWRFRRGGRCVAPVPGGRRNGTGKLPTVSWIVAPEDFSDHPGAPWHGAGYLSETLDILTQNPEVWTKTIFVLSYDENDGCYDPAPPIARSAPSRIRPSWPTNKTKTRRPGEVDASLKSCRR